MRRTTRRCTSGGTASSSASSARRVRKPSTRPDMDRVEQRVQRGAFRVAASCGGCRSRRAQAGALFRDDDANLRTSRHGFYLSPESGELREHRICLQRRSAADHGTIVPTSLKSSMRVCSSRERALILDVPCMRVLVRHPRNEGCICDGVNYGRNLQLLPSLRPSDGSSSGLDVAIAITYDAFHRCWADGRQSSEDRA